MIGIHDQHPAYRTLPFGMLVMILRRQRFSLFRGNFTTTATTAIDPRPSCYCSRPIFFVEYLVFRLKDVTTALIECHVDRSATPLPAYIVTPFDQRACRRAAESIRGPIASSTLYPEDYGFLNSRPPPSCVVKGACLHKIVFVGTSIDGDTWSFSTSCRE